MIFRANEAKSDDGAATLSVDIRKHEERRRQGEEVKLWPR